VAIVILNWNGTAHTLECLQSVQGLRQEGAIVRVVVVDNGSVEDPQPAIAAQFPQVTVLHNGANLGFAAGCNRGITWSLEQGADFVFLLNNDATVAPDLLAVLLDCSARYPQAGALGPKVYADRPRDRLLYAGGRWSWSQGRFINVGGLMRDNGQDWETLGPTDYISGCALWVPRPVIDQVGLLEPDYFLLWEDLDWCRRIQRAGHELLFVPQAKVWHRESASFVGGAWAAHKQYFEARNQLLWMERHLTPWQWLRVSPALAKTWGKHLIYGIGLGVSKSQRHRHRAALQGLWDYGRRRFGDCPPWVRSPL